jgi:hypothetical protein
MAVANLSQHRRRTTILATARSSMRRSSEGHSGRN